MFFMPVERWEIKEDVSNPPISHTLGGCHEKNGGEEVYNLTNYQNRSKEV